MESIPEIYSEHGSRWPNRWPALPEGDRHPLPEFQQAGHACRAYRIFLTSAALTGVVNELEVIFSHHKHQHSHDVQMRALQKALKGLRSLTSETRINGILAAENALLSCKCNRGTLLASYLRLASTSRAIYETETALLVAARLYAADLHLNYFVVYNSCTYASLGRAFTRLGSAAAAAARVEASGQTFAAGAAAAAAAAASNTRGETTALFARAMAAFSRAWKYSVAVHGLGAMPSVQHIVAEGVAPRAEAGGEGDDDLGKPVGAAVGAAVAGRGLVPASLTPSLAPAPASGPEERRRRRKKKAEA